MSAPSQNWIQDSEYNLEDIVVNGVTIRASRRMVPPATRWTITVSTVGRTTDITCSINVQVPGTMTTMADQLARNLVDDIYDAVVALPPAV